MYLEYYLRDAARYPRISHQETLRLARIARNKKGGSKDARNKLIEANLLLVPYLITRYCVNSNGNLQDLVQEGNLGLITAVDRFDPDRGVKFSTYATYWILRNIMTYSKQDQRFGVISVLDIDASNAILREIQRFYVEYGREPDYKELNAKLKKHRNNNINSLSRERIVQLLYLRRIIDSISLSTTVGEGDTSILDLIPDNNKVAEDMINDTLRKIDIGKSLKVLTPKQRKVIILRYGLYGGKSKTLREVGNIIGYSYEGVRKIEKSAFKKLRGYFKEHESLESLV